MNHGGNLLDVVEMIVAEAKYEAYRDVYHVPAWMMRDLRIALRPFTLPTPTTPDKST